MYVLTYIWRRPYIISDSCSVAEIAGTAISRGCDHLRIYEGVESGGVVDQIQHILAIVCGQRQQQHSVGDEDVLRIARQPSVPRICGSSSSSSRGLPRCQ